MIKSNSKLARERIRAYIIDGFHGCDYENEHGVTLESFQSIAAVILADFERVTGGCPYYERMPAQARFYSWLSGLPSMVNTEFFLGCDAARDLVASWLEETETEKNRHSETDAEKFVSYLIYSELLKGVTK